MKLHNLTKYYFLCLLTGISLFSCKENSRSVELLNQAQKNLALNKADVAMGLLDSIQNPQGIDKDSYMRYIVTRVGAKYETGEDITGEALILEAQKYFNEKGKSNESAIANYYTAQLYDESGNFPKALEAYMLTVYESEKSQNHLLAANSFNNIGYIYYQQVILDSAIVSYQKALSYYDKAENVDNKKLITLTNIGRAFQDSKKLDSTYFYFDKCLSLAEQTENKPYQFYSLKNLGVVCYFNQEYAKAINYFQSALALDAPDKLEIQKVHLYLLRIYNKEQNLNSAKQYAELVEVSLPEVTYNYTLKEMYAALADYYNQKGNYEQALKYSELEKLIIERIEREKDIPALMEADKNFYLTQKEREAQKLRVQVFFATILGITALLIILLFVVLVRTKNKKDEAKMRAYTEKYDILREKLASMSRDTDKAAAEIKAILEKADKAEEEKKDKV